MSAISSQLSFPSSGHWNFNPRVFNIMDSIYAIAFGLGLRTMVDAVSQDLKLTGSLIGLWEGVITLHFLKKMPKSSDPYIAYGVRLFVDFLITESMERMVLVLIWTAFGLVLADVTPAIWDEVGLNRVWRHFRRDLYTIYDKIPTVAFFPPQRTVRFLPPRERGRDRDREQEQEPGELSPFIAPSPQDTPIAVIPPLPSEPSESLKHRVPGYYPDYSDTDTDFGSTNRSRTYSLGTEINDAIGTTHYRLSTMPKLNLTYSVSDVDEGNQSSAISSPSVTHDEIPDMEEEVLVDVGIEEEALPVPTPKQAAYIAMPPTPSDSAARWDIHRDVVEGVLHAKPPRQDLPNILDLGEDGGTSDDWEKIHLEDASPTPPPPTPPPKDGPVGDGDLLLQIPPTIPPVPSDMTENRRESLPPAYTSHMDEHEDIYYYPPEKTTDTTADDHANVNVNEHDNNNDNNDLSKISSREAGDPDIDAGASANPWASSDLAAQAQADAAKMQEEEAAERVRKEEEENRILKEEEEERKRTEEEEERKRLEEEETKRNAEREQKEAEEERQRTEVEETKRIEEERERKEAEEKRQMETKRLAEEEEKRLEEEEKKRLEEEKKRLAEEEEKKRLEEEERKRMEAEKEEAFKAQAEELRKEKEAEKKRKADEIAERKKKEKEDDALRKQRQADAAAEQKRKDEDAAKKKEEEDAEQKRKDEDAMKKKMEEEDAERKRQDEDALKKKEVEEQEARDTTEKQKQDEAATLAQKEAEQTELDNQNADTPEEQATEEKEDDSKTVHGLDIFGTQHQQGPSESDKLQDSTTPPPGDFAEEESVISAATTDPPQEAKVRLERMMILRAQMVEVEKRLDQLKGKGLDESSPEVKAAEKTLRKFRRQAERRYNAGMLFSKLCKSIIANNVRAGVQITRYKGPSDNNIFFGALDPVMAGMRIEELLEELLTPSSRSISFKLISGTSQYAKKQKPVVRDTLVTFVSVFFFFII